MINYVRGDATAPIGKGPKVICHIVNNIGAWGAGFVLAVSRRWSEPEKSYLDWFNSDRDFGLGMIQPVLVDDSGDFLWVINMVAQQGVGRDGSPIRYSALRRCLQQVADFAERAGASVHAPRIGCGLAGGSWDLVEPIIQDTLCKQGIDVTIYDFGDS